jgi:hypothetical protein
MFATLSDDDRQATVKATRQEQAALVAAAPETFGVPAYVGQHGWLSIHLATVDPGAGSLVATDLASAGTAAGRDHRR